MPEKTILKDAGQILPSNAIFKYKDYDSYACFSTLFRYKLLFEKGSYWVDTDTICLKPFKAKSEYVFSSEYIQSSEIRNVSRTKRANVGIMKAPPGSDIMEHCYKKSSAADKETLKWGENGPLLVEAAIQEFHLQEYVTHPYSFCPINWWEAQNSISSSFLINIKEKTKILIGKSQAVHLWNEIWRRNNIDKNATFPTNCIYEQLKKRYLK